MNCYSIKKKEKKELNNNLISMADYGLTTGWKSSSKVKNDLCFMSRNVNGKFLVGRCLPIFVP